MAQESGRSPGGRRPIMAWVMVCALAVSLPIVAVVSYAVGVRSGMRARQGWMFEVLVFRRDMDAGEVVTRKDINVVEVDRPYAEDLHSKNLRSLMMGEDLDLLVGSVLDQSVEKNGFVYYRHLRCESESRLNAGMVALAISVPSHLVSGDVPRIFDRVDILARLSVDRGPLRTYRVIEGVRVMAIGGRQAARDLPGPKGIAGTERASPRSYRTVAIEVPSEVSLDLANVLSHRVGDLQVEICSGQMVAGARPAQVNPELGSLAITPRQEAAPAGQPEP